MADQQVQHAVSVLKNALKAIESSVPNSSEVPAPTTASTSRAPGPTTFLDDVRRDFSYILYRFIKLY